MAGTNRRTFAMGFVIAAVAVAAFALVDDATPPSVRRTEDVAASVVARPGLNQDVQKGPLLDARKITLDEAKRLSQYSLPVPDTNSTTGDRTGIWIDPTAQIAFVWGTDLRFYVAPSTLTEEEAASDWATKVATYPEEGRQLVTVRGHAGIGRDGSNLDGPSNLTWIERGLVIQLVSPAHTLQELIDIAESITYEE